MLRFLAIVIGLLLIGLGVAGYLPNYMENGLLLGYFYVDNMINVVHLATGVIALLSGISNRLAKTFFIIFGLAYTSVAIFAFWNQGDLYVVTTNGPDNLLHLGIGVVMLLFGIGSSSD